MSCEINEKLCDKCEVNYPISSYRKYNETKKTNINGHYTTLDTKLHIITDIKHNTEYKTYTIITQHRIQSAYSHNTTQDTKRIQS